MGSEWKEVGLNDLGEVARGKSRHRPRYAEHLYGGAYPFIQTGDVKASGGLITNHSQTYSEDGLAQSRLWPAGTMCITIAANIAETGILSYPACFPDSVIGFIADENKCDVRFIEYRFRYLKAQLQREAIGSVQDNINLATFERLRFSIPALIEQKKISNILGSLDNKIQLNRETNQTLEAMAQALFKSWFVDFDPVFDNIIAHNLAHNNAPLHNIPEPLLPHAQRRLNVHNVGRGSARQTAAHAFHHLFPQAFEQSDEPSVGIQGWVPKGWGVKNITELADTISNTYPLKTVDKVIFLNTGDIEAGNFLHKNYSEVSTLPGQAKKMIQKDDILYSEIRPKNKRFAYVYFDGTEHVVSTKLMVLRAKEKANSRFVYFLLTLNKTISDLQRIAELRSGTFPQITYNELSLIKAAIPSDGNVLKAFSNIMLNTYYNKNLQIQAQNEELKKLRDTLLPKLISGELRIPDAEQVTEALAK